MAKNITKHALVADIARGSRLPQKDIQEVVEDFLSHLKSYISKGRTIEIRGFGTFSHQGRKRRPARNIHTGEVVALPERLVPVFRFCDKFRKRVTITEVTTEG